MLQVMRLLHLVNGPYSDDSASFTLDDGTYTVNMVDSYGDGWNGNVLTVSDATNGLDIFYGYS